MTLIDAWAPATSEDDVTTFNALSNYYFGQLIQTHEQPLKMGFNQTLQESQHLGKFTVDLSHGVYPLNDISANFYPVNGLPWYWGLGKATHTTSNTKQTLNIFDITSGVKPVTKCVSLYETKPHEAYGVCWSSVQWHHAFGSPCSVVMKGMGCKHGLTTSSVNTPTYPSSQSDMFDTLKYLKIGVDGAEDIISNIVAVDIGVSQNIVGNLSNVNPYYDHIHHATPVSVLVNLAIAKTNLQLLEDAFAQETRSFIYRAGCSKNSNKYFEVDSSEAYIVGNNAVKNKNEVLGYNLTLQLPDPNFIIQDYVNDSFYEIPT